MNATPRRTPAGTPAGGEFARHDRDEPTLSLTPPAPGHRDEIEAAGLRTGDWMVTNTHTDSGPLAFAIMRNRPLRRALSAAGMPRMLQVVSTRKSDLDPRSDTTVTFDIGGTHIDVDLHVESTVTIARRDG